MKKILLAVAVVFAIGGCLPFTPAPNPTPIVDVAATSAANIQTAVAQTLTALPTATSAPPSATSASLASDTPSASPTTATITEPAVTGTFDVATGTNVSGTPSTSIPTLPAGQVSAAWTLAVRTYGTLPPQVPFAHITLINKAKAEAYISLHVDLDGSNTVIEYPVTGTTTIRAPLGFYRYVTWVGGRQMVGEFRLHEEQDLTIILYKDRVVIK